MDQKRIEYIDALRGLAILSVVFMHIANMCQGIGGMYLVMTTRLAVPLFFFISGYLSSCKITPPEFWKNLQKVQNHCGADTDCRMLFCGSLPHGHRRNAVGQVQGRLLVHDNLV